MSSRNCPKCQRELPIEVLRGLEQGVECPYCATRLKRTPRRASTPAGGDQAAFAASYTPPLLAQPIDEDSFGWFQKKGAPGAAAPSPPAASPPTTSASAVAPSPAPSVVAPVRSPFRSLPSVAMPGLTPPTSAAPEPPRAAAAPVIAAPPVASPAPATPAAPAPAARTAAAATAPTEVQKRPSLLDTSPPRPPAEARRAPTLIGTAASLAEKPSLAPVDKPPPPPVEKSSPRLADKPSPPPVEKRSPPPALKPSPPAPVPPAVVHPVAVEPQRAALAMTAVEPPRAALAMTAVIPSTGSTLALAAPSLGFLPRSRRNLAVAAGAATLTVAVAILLTHRSPADPQGSVAADLSAVPKPPGVSAPLAVLHETPRPPTTLEPLAAPAAHGAKGAAADDAAKAAPQAHERVRTTPPAAAHQRRYAKQEKRGKHARHDKRNARRTEVASRAAASPGNDSEARASYERGNTLLFSGDAAGAVTAYQKAVALAPADPIGYRGLGLAHEQRGETGAAIRALRKYLKLAPGAADREIISRRIARLGRAASQP